MRLQHCKNVRRSLSDKVEKSCRMLNLFLSKLFSSLQNELPFKQNLHRFKFIFFVNSDFSSFNSKKKLATGMIYEADGAGS